MQTIEEYKEYTKQLEGEVKQWHDAFDASQSQVKELAKENLRLERERVEQNSIIETCANELEELRKHELQWDLDKARIKELENMPHTDNSAVIELLENENAELKQKLHDAEMRADLAEAACNEYRLDYKKLADSQRWRKCSDELPEENVDVLIYDEDSGIVRLSYMEIMPDGQIWFWPMNSPHIDGVTYWMPLPKAPEVK